MRTACHLPFSAVSVRAAVLTGCCLITAQAARADIIFDLITSAESAQYYGSQGYAEIKGPLSSGIQPLLASAGILQSRSNPLGPVNQSGTLNASGSTLNYSASARLDGFGLAHAAVTIDVSNAGADYGYNSVASQSSRTQVLFSSAQTAGQVVFNFGISGTQSTPYGLALGRLDFLARSFQPDNGSNYDVFGADALHAVEAGNYSFTYTGVTASPLDILFYAAAGVVIQDGTSVPAGANFSAFANFANTFDLESIDLFTEDGTEITEWTLTDEATQQVVFDQNGRVEIVSVPEPSTYTLCGLSLACMAMVRRRRARG